MSVKNLIKWTYLKRTISLIVLICFFVTSLNIQPVQALEYTLPKPGTMVPLSPWFNPPVLKGIKVHTDNPFKFDFILDKGDADLSDHELKEESAKLIKYFLASLTIPEKDLWVNLSPYEKGRIIPPNFGDTEMGEQLLAQDYLLKQVTASVLYPEGEIGREFWRKVYTAAYEKYGTHNIPVKTFNKVWIMPDKAVVFENSVNNSVMVVQSSLKVMLEEDYLALNKSGKNVAPQSSSALGSQIVREIIIPQITKEVNEGKNFAALRQVYSSLILASWYKYKLKHSLLNKGYADQSKSGGVDVKDKDTSEEIYQQYLKSFRKGVYNYIKEDEDPVTHEMIPRKYFSGGVTWEKIGDKVRDQVISGPDAAQLVSAKFRPLKMLILTVGLAAGLAVAAPAAKAQSVTMAQPTVTTTVAKGDTASQLVVRSIQNMTGKKIGWGSFLNGVQNGTFTLQYKGKNLQNPNWNKIIPGEKIVIDVTKLAAHPSASHVNKPLISSSSNFVSPVLPSSVSAPSGITPLVSASPVSAAPVTASAVASSDVSTPLISTSASPDSIVPVLPVTSSTAAGAGSPPGGGPPVPDPFNFMSSVLGVPPTVGGPPLPDYLAAPTGTVSAPVGTLQQQLSALNAQLDQLNASDLKDEDAIQQNINERERLGQEIQAVQDKLDAQISPEEEKANETALVRDYKLTVQPQPTFSIPPYAENNANPPIVTFTPNAVGLAYADYRIREDQKLGKQTIKSKLPISVLFLRDYDAEDLSAQLRLGAGNSFSIAPDLPGRNLLNLVRIGQGLSKFGAQAPFSQVAGPLFAGQIVAQLRNYAVMNKTRGQDVRYDARMSKGKGILESVTVHVVPVVSYDQNNRKVTEYLYSVGLVDTVQAVFGKLDGAFGNKGLLGNSKDHFVSQNAGFQLQINDYHQAFTYAAAKNTDPNVMTINVYQVQDQNARYRKNKDHGWDKVAADTPLDPTKDYYDASVKGFVLRYNPNTHKITAQQVFTGPTFITGAFAHQLARDQGDQGSDYLSKPLMERELSQADLKMERMLIKGADDQGNIIYGALRSSVTGRIVKFITNPADLNTMSNLTDNKGHAVQFVPGTGISSEHGVLRDYVVDELGRVKEEWRGLIHTETAGEKYAHYDLSKRPQLKELPPELASSLSNGDSVFYDPSVAMKAITAMGEKYYGVIYFADGRAPAPLTSLDNMRTIGSLKIENGVSDNGDSTYSFNGFDKKLTGNTLVFLDNNNQVIGVIDPSVNLKRERMSDLETENQAIAVHAQELKSYGFAIDENQKTRPLTTEEDFKDFKPARYAGVTGQTFGTVKPVVITEDMMVKVQNGQVVEILETGAAAVQERITVVKTLQQGGSEVEDQRSGKFLIYAKGNDLSAEQVTAGILPERELASLVWTGQAAVVPVEGSDQKRFVILPQASQSRLSALIPEAARPSSLPDSIQTLADLNENYGLIRWKAEANNAHSPTDWVSVETLNKYEDAISRNAIEILKINAEGETTGRYVRVFGEGYQLWSNANVAANVNTHALIVFKDHHAEFMAMDQLKGATGMLNREAKEILKINADGDTVGRYERVYGEGYVLWNNGVIPINLRTHGLAIFKDRHAEFITLKQFNDPGFLKSIRPSIDEIQLMDVGQHVVGRVYLDPSVEGNRIELINGNTSKIYELSHFNPFNPENPVSETFSFIDKDGLKHVKTSDLRAVNKGIFVEDVYQLHSGAKPVKLYSVRPLQKETIYFNKDGHEYYSISNDTGIEAGQTVVIDGRAVEHVTGLFKFDGKTGVGLHVSLRDLEKKGWYAPIRRSVFTDERLIVDETGFEKLEQGRSSYDQIMDSFESKGHLNERDEYAYDANGKGTDRKVSFQANGVWSYAWTIKVGVTGPQARWFTQLNANDVIASAFAKYGIDRNTTFTETFRENTQGVISIDYRIAGDVLERKFITVMKEGGRISKIIVGLDFDGSTGEQTLAYVLTPDLQVKSMMRTVPNNLSISQILPSQTADEYSKLVAKHYNISGANLWDDFAPLGVSQAYIPDKIEETPFIIGTDQPQLDGYKATEQSVSALVKEYMNAHDQDRPAILEKIQSIVRSQDKGKSRYTTAPGSSSFHYLFPNSSRDLEFVTQYSSGDIEMNFWQFEGREMTLTNGRTSRIKLPANIVPGNMVLNSSGEIVRSLLFNHTEQKVFKDANGAGHLINVNYYHTLDLEKTELLQTVGFTGTGELVSESNKYVRNRVMNGEFGVETRGEETVYYDIFSPYPSPLYGTLDEDGRITKVTLNQIFGQGNVKEQKIITSSLEANPTAPKKYTVQTVTNIDGVTVEGSKHEEDTLKGYWKDIKDYWALYFSVPGALAALFLSGSLIQKIRLSKIKKKLDEDEDNNTTTTSEPVPDREVVLPSWNNYGLSDDVVSAARSVFEGSIVPALKKRPLEDVLNEQFESYQIWRKNIMKINEPFTPTIEDLWLAILIYVDGDIYRADMPDGLNYLFHKTIEARAQGKGDGIAGFIHKEFKRWHRIVELQQTTFQGISGGDAKHVVPYDFYFRIEDLNDMFRNKAQMEWYDALGYTLDGEQDLRGAIYDDFTASLAKKVSALKKAITDIAPSYDKNVFRMKRALPKLQEFQDYILFFRQAQQGEYQLSDTFNFKDVSKSDAERLIGHKPLMLKTFSDSGAWAGSMPMPIRALKSVAQMVRGNYNPLMYSGALSVSTGLAVASFDGLVTATFAAVAAGLVFIALKLLYYPLSYLLDRNVNNKSFGKPLPPWTGYKKLQATKEQKTYRTAFWSMAISAKVVWDAFLLHYFLIPHFQTLGGTYFPQIFGYELPFNFNVLIMVAQWSISALFLFLASWSSYYFFGSFFSYIHGAVRGIGTIKTGKDIKDLQQDKVLDRLIDQKLLPEGGRDMTADVRENARKSIWNFVFGQMRNSRDEISDKELGEGKKGVLDKFESETIQKRMARAVNALLMKMPKMPDFDNVKTSTFMIPMFGEDNIYPYEAMDKMPTSLEAELNVGYTNLNFIISKAQNRWVNLIERVKREGIANDDEIKRMEDLLTQNGKLGPVNDKLKMQIRLWATYEGQGFARTLDGMMNYVRWLQQLAKISHPEWDEQTIRTEVNKKFQMLWAYQVWGDILKAGADQPQNQLKKEDTIYLMKKYYEELGFYIDIASLQQRNGIWYKVLSRYNPSTESIQDVEAIAMTEERPITLEGKPSNQMHASTFVRNAVQFTVDMNQDLTPEQAVKLPVMLEEFEDQNVAAVNFPEDIFTSGFSLAALFHAIADRTFVTTSKRQLAMLLSPFHHGHPDAWRSSMIRQHGGVSSTTSVSEDFIGGLRLVLKGKTIKNVEYIEFGKARELSWAGTEGIFRKFSMGSGQYMLSRHAHWANQRLGPLESMANFFGGVPFYFKETVAAIGLMAYSLIVMVMGISSFAAFNAGIVVAMAGVLVIGQAITMNGFTQMALEDGIKRTIKTFALTSAFMVPFFIAHVFTAQAGYISGILGLAAYVVTGRGFNRGHVPLDEVLKSYSKSHAAVGIAGTALAVIALSVWRNWTFVSSALVMLSFVFVVVVPFFMNSGTLPVRGVSGETSRKFFKEDVKAGSRLIKETFQKGMAAKDYRKAFIDTVLHSISFGVWGSATMAGHAGIGAAKAVARIVPKKKNPPPADKAMTTRAPGGIDMGKISLAVESDGKGVTMGFDDMTLLELLRNADGLSPIIYSMKVMTPSMLRMWEGI